MLALLSRRLLTVYALMCALLGAALVIGATIPIAPHTSIFSKSICALPCVYGLTPGVSTRDQARQTFAPSALSLSLINADQPSYVLRQADDSHSMLAMIDFGSATSTIVRSVQLYPMSAAFDLGTLSDFLLAGYAPKQVFSSCQSSGTIILTLGDGTVYVEVSSVDGVAPDTVIRLLGTAGSRDTAIQSFGQFVCINQQAWTGFAAVWKYA